MANELYILNANQILLEGLQLSYAETAITNATVTFTAYTIPGNVVVTGASAISMTHQGSGDYLGTMDDDAALNAGQDVRVKVKGTLSDGTKFQGELICPVKTRGAT